MSATQTAQTAPNAIRQLAVPPMQQELAARAPGLRYPTSKKTIYDRNLNRSKGAELSRAAFAYLFVEMVSYAQRRVTGIADLEKRLNAQGYPIGLKLLDLLIARIPGATASSSSSSSSSAGTAAATARPTRILPLLQFITTTLWKHLFGRPADALERAANNAAEYMVSDNEPLVNMYISVPREMSQLNCAAFVAGIIEGVCDGAGFSTLGVSAHSVSEQTAADGSAAATSQANMWPNKTLFLIKFRADVLEREDLLAKTG